ncbi:MAG: winged helix-turn-helix domain-containing protein [Oligoflexales bacterium]
MPTVWICEKIKSWERSLIAMLCCKYPVFLVDELEKLIEGFALRQNQDLKGHLIIDLDSFDITLKCLRTLISPLKPTGSTIILSKEFQAQEKLNTPIFSEKPEYLVNTLNSEIVLTRLIGKSTSSEASNNGSIRYKTIEFSFEKMFLRFLPDGEPESLPLKEARLLRVLLQDPTKIWTRNELQQAVWDRLKVSPRTIDSHISRLRKKLHYSGINIESKYGGGYTIT